MMNNDPKIENILQLSAEERYGYLIRKVADAEEIWMLKDVDGFCTLGDDGTQPIIPVFPEAEFSQLLLIDDWANCEAVSLDADDFLDLLDSLEEDGILIAGFPTPEFNTVVVSAADMKEHLLAELEQYEDDEAQEPGNEDKE